MAFRMICAGNQSSLRLFDETGPGTSEMLNPFAYYILLIAIRAICDLTTMLAAVVAFVDLPGN